MLGVRNPPYSRRRAAHGGSAKDAWRLTEPGEKWLRRRATSSPHQRPDDRYKVLILQPFGINKLGPLCVFSSTCNEQSEPIGHFIFRSDIICTHSHMVAASSNRVWKVVSRRWWCIRYVLSLAHLKKVLFIVPVRPLKRRVCFCWLETPRRWTWHMLLNSAADARAVLYCVVRLLRCNFLCTVRCPVHVSMHAPCLSPFHYHYYYYY